MKKTVFISGIITILLLSFILTGWADMYDSVNKALRRGNGLYAAAKYEDALAEYETGIEKQTENGSLSFNAAQSAYLLGEYEKAAKYYENAEDSVDKYLSLGNIYFKAGGVAQDANQKAQCYKQALELYEEGIIKFPNNVPLKYNYETVKALLDDIQEKTEQENKDKSDDKDENENESNGENGNQNESEGEDKSGDQKESESQENQSQESEKGEGAQNEQDENSGQGEDAAAQDEAAQDEAAQDEAAQNEAAQGEAAQGKGQEGDDKQQVAEAADKGEYDPEQEAIERVLAVLESQEEESLKNNREVVGRKGDKYDW